MAFISSGFKYLTQGGRDDNAECTFCNLLFINILSANSLVVSRLQIADDTVASGLGINRI